MLELCFCCFCCCGAGAGAAATPAAGAAAELLLGAVTELRPRASGLPGAVVLPVPAAAPPWLPASNLEQGGSRRIDHRQQQQTSQQQHMTLIVG